MIVLLSLWGCGKPDAPSPDPVDVPTTPPSSLTVTDGGEAPLPDAPPDGRGWRRMDVGQLDASMRLVSNGIGWDVSSVNQFEDLSATLGVPDYIGTTVEDFTPGLLFQKFLDDAANAVCADLVEREAAGSADNVFLIHVDLGDTYERESLAIEQNLSAAVLRFHGRDAPVGSLALDPWVWLYESAEHVTGDDTTAAWTTVCVALFTHPDFYTY